MKPIAEGNYYRHPVVVGSTGGYLLCSSCETLREKRLDRKEAALTGLVHCTECSRQMGKNEEIVGYPRFDAGRLGLVYYCQPCLARVQEKLE